MNNVFAHKKYVGYFVDFYVEDCNVVRRLEIVRIDDDNYPVVCEDTDGEKYYFTKDGRYTSYSGKPCLKRSNAQPKLQWDYGTPPEVD